MGEIPGYNPEEKRGIPDISNKEKWATWQKEGRERFDMARGEHERASQEYLAKAEQAKTADELYQLFCGAKYWHHQKDLIYWAAASQNRKNFEFLTSVAGNSGRVPDWDENSKFYEDNDFVSFERKIEGHTESRSIETSFHDLLNSDSSIFDYEEYLIRILAQSFGQYNSPEFRAQAEEQLLLLMELMPEKFEQLRHELERFGPADPQTLRTDHEEDDGGWDYRSSEAMAELFGYDDGGYFNETYSNIIQSLGQVGTEKSIKPIADLVRTKPIELFRVMAESFSKISPPKAAHEMLPMLRDGDPLVRRTASKILYRLEFGKIGISDEGVEYLERMYDLGEYNNPDYFANRLTADGDVGIFDENKSLIKHFNLGDLSTDEKRVKARVLDFTYDTLFIPKPNETAEERQRREKVLEEFQSRYFDFYNNDFFKETRVHFNNLSFAEQGWYLHFMTNADEMQKQRALDFVRSYGEDGFRTFLSLEQGEAMGQKILDLGEKLVDLPQAGRLFATYSRFVEAVHEKTADIAKIHEQIFTQPIADDNQITSALLVRINELLVNASEEIAGQPAEKRGEIIKRLIGTFAREETALNITFLQFKTAAEQLREAYKRVVNDQDLYEAIFEKEKFWQEVRSTGTLDASAEQKIRENDPHRITSEVLEGLIEIRQKEIDGFPEHLETMQLVDETSARQYKDAFEREIRPKYLKEITELKRLLKFQKVFEQKFQALVLGREQAKLDAHILENLPEKVKEVKPEALPAAEPLYFPVGISKDWPKWKDVLEGKLAAAKPVEIYGYLFWLNNQGRKVKLAVVDEIQASNYQNLYGLSEQDAHAAAAKVGQKEMAWYQKAVETFGLKNIEVQDYRAFQQEAGDKLEYYRKLSERFAEMPVFKPAFLAMVQESVADREKEKYLPYALEEVSWILARNGTKVSHRNEARYDLVAAFVKNLEILAERQGGETIVGMDESRLIPLARVAVQGLNDFFNKKISAAKTEEEQAYWSSAFNSLRLIRAELNKRGTPKADRSHVRQADIRYDFAIPRATGQSFGWTATESKQIERSGFKEPYSTYFYQSGAEVFLNSDQVVAVPEGLIAGKVMALSEKAQNRYAETVIAPMLVQYFKSLEQAPAGYFEGIGKNREELLAECQDADTLHELLQFAQKYIIRPAASAVASERSAAMTVA